MDNARLIKDHLIDEFEISVDESKSMTVEYIISLEMLYQQANEELSNPSWDDLYRISHSIKGTSYNIGAYETGKLGEKLQEACESKNIDQFKDNIKELNKVLTHLKQSQKEL